MSEGKQEARTAPRWVSEATQQITDEFCGGSDAAEDRIAATILSEFWDAEDAARQANQPQPVNAQRAVRQLERSFDAARAAEPQGKAQPDSGEPLTQYVDEADLQAAFQRGQKAMAEKAAQPLTADDVRIALQPLLWKQFAWQEAADALNHRSLASAEPPQDVNKGLQHVNTPPTPMCCVCGMPPSLSKTWKQGHSDCLRPNADNPAPPQGEAEKEGRK